MKKPADRGLNGALGTEVEFKVSTAPVREQINRMIADNHRILRDMGIEFVG